MEMLKLTNAYARDQPTKASWRNRDILPGHHHKAHAETLLMLTRQQPRDETREGEPQAVRDTAMAAAVVGTSVVDDLKDVNGSTDKEIKYVKDVIGITDKEIEYVKAPGTQRRQISIGSWREDHQVHRLPHDARAQQRRESAPSKTVST